MEIVEKHNKQWLVTCPLCESRYKMTNEDLAKTYTGNYDEKTKITNVRRGRVERIVRVQIWRRQLRTYTRERQSIFKAVRE